MTTPIPSNGYPIPANNPTGKAFWQDALDNLHGRLVDIKAEIDVTIASLGEDATAQALALVADSIAPQLASLTAEMDALQAAIALAEDALAALQAGGVEAVNVPVEDFGTLGPNWNAQQVLEYLETARASLVTAVATANTDIDALETSVAGLDAALLLRAPSRLLVAAKSAAYTAVAADANTVIRCTNTFTLGLTAAATLAAGWNCFIQNDGTGVITIDPDGAETIDGRSTIKVYPGERFMLHCDGTKFTTFGRTKKVAIGTVSVGAAAATWDIELGFDDTEFSSIEIIISGMSQNSGSNRDFLFRMKEAGAYLAGATDYFYQLIEGNSVSTDNEETAIRHVPNVGSAVVVAASLRIDQLGSSRPTLLECRARWGNGVANIRGGRNGSAQCQGLRVLLNNTGNINAGSAELFGYRD